VPIANPDQYNEMLTRAKDGGFAYPAINVTSSQTLNAAIKGFADAGSDGIIQVSTGGAAYFAGGWSKDMVVGATAMAEMAQVVAQQVDVTLALHTDHCPENHLDGFMRPLIEISRQRVADGGLPLFQSHMWDGSAVELGRNLQIAQELLAACTAANIVMELEVGVVGGEEDGVDNEINEKLYTTNEDFLATIDAIGTGERGRYMLAATFGNVHGVYKPGNVKLRPSILRDGQAAAAAKLGLADDARPFDLVFHGGSGSTPEEIAEAVGYGVIKMNVDTDTQYAFTRPVVGHVMESYDSVLKIDGEVGNKKSYDPRAWGKKGEANMAARVVQACTDLGSHGTSMSA
jgi:fructose-bisphosphate aldolase class II